MAESDPLIEFATVFRAEVQRLTENALDEEERFLENVFTDEFLRYLDEGEEVDFWTPCSIDRKTMKVDAIHLPDRDDCIDLFVSHMTGEVPPATVDKAQIERLFTRVKRFLSRSLEGLHSELDESSEAQQAARLIYDKRRSINRARMFLLTDGRATTSQKDPESVDGIQCFYHIWDIKRLYRLHGLKEGRQLVEIDFRSKFGQPIPCLPVEGVFEHETCVAIFPGRILCEMYAEWGSQLLQRNVRSFLQARSKVNKGIRKTIETHPDRFLAYNNGITATAAEIQIVPGPTGWVIEKVKDFQIVNGGQTTAGIYHAAKQRKADLSKVSVQAKISRIRDSALIEEIVPLISMYANSQNKISESDFASNDPFHRQVQELSKKVWAPPTSTTKHPTLWYYERARGQYSEDRSRNGRAFEKENPSSQTFDKTELAKVVSCFDCEPFTASLGPQKNFRVFSKRLAEQTEDKDSSDTMELDSDYFKSLIAKIILLRSAKKIIDSRKEKMTANRSNVLYYTISYMVHNGIVQDAELAEIWRNQQISEELGWILESLSVEIYDFLVRTAGERIVAEWCKKEDCWDVVKLQKF